MEDTVMQRNHEVMFKDDTVPIEQRQILPVVARPGDKITFGATDNDTVLLFPLGEPFETDPSELLGVTKTLAIPLYKENVVRTVKQDAQPGDYPYTYYLKHHKKMLEGGSPPYIRIIKDPPTRNDPGGGG